MTSTACRSIRIGVEFVDAKGVRLLWGNPRIQVRGEREEGPPTNARGMKVRRQWDANVRLCYELRSGRKSD